MFGVVLLCGRLLHVAMKRKLSLSLLLSLISVLVIIGRVIFTSPCTHGHSLVTKTERGTNVMNIQINFTKVKTLEHS